jgi:hypothetical protein
MSDEQDLVMSEEQFEKLMEGVSDHKQSESSGRALYGNPGIDCMNPRCPYGEFDALIVSDIGWMEFAAHEAMAMCMCEVETDEGRRKLMFLHEIE